MGEIRKAAEQRTSNNWHHAQAPPWSISPSPASPQKASYLCEDAGTPLQAWGSPRKSSDHFCHVISAPGALAALTQTTWAVDATSSCKATSRLVLTKAFGGSCKSRTPRTWANLSTCRLWAAAAVQGVVIRDSGPCLRCRMLFQVLCSLVFLSPVQSSQAPLNTQTSN